MASTINEIIKITLEKLRAEHLSLTPDNYSKAFCKVAKDKKVVVEDCQKVDKTLKRLDKSLQNEAKRFKVNDIDELLKYFVALINRSNTAEHQKVVQSFVLLSKRLLQAISMLHNKEATTLANTSLERLETNTQPQTIELIRDKWLELISNYDDSFFDKLDSFGISDKNDLQKTIKEVYKLLNDGDNEGAYVKIAPLIVATLTPSLASSMNDDLATLSYELKAKPEMLASPAVQEDIKAFIKKRIELDKKEVSSRISSLNSLLDAINQKILNLLSTSESHTKEVANIKTDLQAIDVKKDSFELIQSKLLKIANSLESETKSLTEHMQSDKKTISSLQNRINRLEGALVEAKKESKEDFLTQVATKRALSEQLERAEEAYARYQINYSLCFFDIDHFKMINDTYGHEAGDVILATLGKILNKYVRRVDFVGRYGGEEFLAILPNITQNQAIIFANKIRKIIENFKFIYKKERINVAISGGVSERQHCKSKDDTVESADKQLYIAKKNGRNQISPNK